MLGHVNMGSVYDAHVDFSFQEPLAVFGGPAGGNLGDVVLRQFTGNNGTGRTHQIVHHPTGGGAAPGNVNFILGHGRTGYQYRQK